MANNLIPEENGEKQFHSFFPPGGTEKFLTL